MISPTNASPSDMRSPTAAMHKGRDGRQLRRSATSSSEKISRASQLRDRGDHYLPAGADAAKARSDVEPGEREHEPRAGEEAHDRG